MSSPSSTTEPGYHVEDIDWRQLKNASDDTPWRKNKGALKLNFFLSVIFCGMVLNGYDGTIISRLQALDSWYEDLGNPSLPAIGLLNASGYMSGILAGPLINYIDDNFGRRWGIRFYGYTMLIGTVLGCVAGLPNVNGYALFVTGRVCIGFGLSSFLMTSLIVVQEITHPRSRATMAASWDSYWILGSVIASWTVFGTSYISNSWSWRIPYIIQVPFALYILIGTQFVPETPRFLMAHGREQEAFDFFVEYHGNGNVDDELVRFEFEEVKEALRLEKEAKSAKWRTILKDKPSLHRLSLAALMTFMTTMSGSSILYLYYTVALNLVGITNTTVQTGVGAGLSMWTWFVQIAAVFVGKRVGSKKILLWVWPFLFFCLAGLCAAGGAFARSNSEDTKAGVATVVMVWLYLGFFNFTNPVLYAYPAEIQTYSLRAKGLLVWNTLNQCLGVYTSYTDAVALDRIGFWYYLVYMPLVVVQWFLAYRYMVETHSYTLEEIALAFGSEVHLPRLERIARDQEGRTERSREVDVENKK